MTRIERSDYINPQSAVSPIIKQAPYSSPFSVLESLKDQPYCFLLESSLEDPERGRFSFIGSNPFLTIKSLNNRVEVSGDESHITDLDPFEVVKNYLNKFSFQFECDLPFIGGAVGYFGYDLRRFVEKFPNRKSNDLNTPDLVLNFYDSVIIFDHKQKQCMISMLPGLRMKSNGPDFEQTLANIHNNGNQSDPEQEDAQLRSLFSKASYVAAVRKIKDYISAGDIFQVNLSQRFETVLKIEPLQLYARLRRINPAPFSAYLDLGEFQIVSSSPERFLKIREGTVETRPIKGTRRRGRDSKEDVCLANALVASEKDQAENLMIVDLLRNDLGKVCEFGSVEVRALCELETYPSLFHLVSTVTGKIKSGVQCIDVLKACFPGGSVTGAPKIRAMEIIDELEPKSRGVYTGSIGYIGFNGNMDTNIVIRTIIVKDGKAYFHVGGGIVADSDPESEYAETLDKARALIQALTGNIRT
ncbi:MAG: aminodeoxychorismate synthase component I [Candidatus Bathyarchaeia archaeon]